MINPADQFSDVSATALLTLFCRAKESQSPDPILIDEKAVEVVRRLTPELAASPDPLLRMLASGRIDPRLVVHIALRAKKYDEYARSFLSLHADGMVVNLGCGMDSRFMRIDDGNVTLCDLDLPDMIAFKKRFIQPTERYHMIGTSVFDIPWREHVTEYARPVIFLAEGLFMYLPGDQVKSLVVDLCKRFPGAEMVCEMVAESYTRGFMQRMTQIKMRRQLKLGEQAVYQFGLRDSREMEHWHPAIQYLDEWSYFDTNHPRLGWMRIFRKSAYFRKVQYTVRYRFRG